MGAKARFMVGLMAVAAAAGCTRTIELARVPACCVNVRTVAVAPFNNRSSKPRAAELIPQRLAAVLAVSRTYTKVIGQRELMGLLKDADLTLPTDDPAAIARTVGQLVPGVDAVIIGTVEAYDYDRLAYMDISNFRNYMLYPYRGLPTYSGYSYYYPGVVTYNSEVVRLVVTASMVSVPEGNVLATISPQVGQQRISAEARPEQAEMRLKESCDAAARQLATAFIKVAVEVEVDPARAVRTARVDPKTDELRFTDNFKAADSEVVVIIDLPSEAVRNDFRVTITPWKSDHVLARQDFTWGPADLKRRLVFPAGELTEKTPAKHFAVHLYTDGEEGKLLITRRFKIQR